MKKIALTFGIIICTYIVCFSQNDCHESYTKILGSLIDSERGYSIAGNEAEKILYVGGLKNDSVIIIKVTTNGEIVWARTFDVIKGSPDHINGLLIDSEGKLCVAGTSTSALPAGSAFVFRYDPDLNSVLWAIKLSNSSVTTTLGIIEMGPGGNYLLSANPSNPNNAELNELDRNTGAVQNNFSKEYDLGNAETFQDLFFYNNNIYACGRFTDGDAFERMRSTLVKLDPSDGSIDWITLGHRPKNVDARLYNVDLVIAQQKIYSVTVGDEDGGSVDFTNIFIQRTSLNGDVEWIKKVDLPGTNDWADEIIATENGFVVMCRNRVPPSDIILFKFDSSGNLIWSRKYDFSANDNSITLGGISSQLIELDHHFYFTAFAQSSGSEDMIVVKTDLNGEISDTCQVSKPVDVVFTDVVNPVFYTVTPETENSDPDITSLTIIPRTTNINVRNVCAQPASIVSEINQTICEGEQFEGYTTQGMYIDTFITNGGCDSVRTLHLSVASCPAACGSSTTGIFGITGEELRGYSLAASPSNDGFYLAGLKEDSVLIVKADLAGQILWSRTFDIVPNLAEHVYAILVDSDGMLAVAGTVGDPSINSSVFAFRYNPNTKQVLWVKEYFSDPICFNFSMIEKGPGGNYLLTNSYFQTVVSNNDSELLEIDKNTGSIIPTFSNHYHLGSSETIYDLVYYKNFLYGVGRYTDGPDEGDMRNTLIKLNPADGSKVWSKMGHRPKNVTARLYGVDLVIDQDNIYSVCHGDPSGTSVTNTKLYIQKTDLEGNLIWLKQYELAGSTDAGYSIIKSGTGFVVIAGVKLTNELALFKIDTDGNVLWARNFIFPENLIPKTYFNVVGVTSLIEVGQSLLFTSYMSNAIKGSKLLLIKTDLEGKSNIPCVDNQPLSIPVQTISNPIFYSVEPIVVTYNPLEIIHTVSGVISGISPSEGCFTSDTIFSEINATICEGMQYEGHTIQGTYIDTFTTSKGCDSLRTLHLSVNSIIRSTIHKEICSGQTFEGFDHTGVFRDTFQLISGCDSIRTLHLTILTCDPVVTYDLDACKSNMLDGSNMIYTEFTPQYPTTVSCGNFAATTLQRAVFPDNKHSCTPGVNGSIGMCVNSLNSCTYVPGNPVSVFFEVEINPETDSTIAFNKLEFYAKGPANYVWVNGPTGPNNYPRFYGIRILKNNVEIFQKHDLPTSLTWSLQSFNFNDLEEFKVSTPTTFRIELLPYCPINNGAEVSAWDIDEIEIFGSCFHPQTSGLSILGHVRTWNSSSLRNATINLEDTKQVTSYSSYTATDGLYVFDNLQKNKSYTIRGNKNTDVLAGVSTLDMIRIQKHLLGIDPFTSLDQFVAADINKSGTITVMDLIDLRKTILGIYSQFPNNTSWRLGLVPMDMTSHEVVDFVETRRLESLSQIENIVDFLGVKIGDVNRDGNPGIVSNNQIENRNDEAFILNADNINLHTAEKVFVNVSASESGTLEGIQLALKLKDLSLVSIEGKMISVTTENYVDEDNDLIKISWSQAHDLTFSKGDILFRMTFIPTKPGFLNDNLEIATNSFPSEIYSNDVAIPVRLGFQNKAIDEQKSNIDFVEIKPNPFSTTTEIKFHLAQKGLVRISFFNTSGQLLSSSEEMYSDGPHSIQAGSELLPNADYVYYCQVVCNSQTIIKKLVRIRQ